jgi:sugar phosphate isomerase/epimerase
MDSQDQPMLKLATKFAPQADAFETALKAGFRYAEFWLSPELLQQSDAIVQLARQYPLAYVPHMPNKRVDQAVLLATIDLARQLNCETVVLHQPIMDAWGAEFQTRCPEVKLAVENHNLNEKEFWQWAERNPGLNLDVEHLWMFTLKDSPLGQLEKMLQKFLERFADKLNHVHLPGYWPGLEEHRPMYCSRELMWAVWPLLSEISFSGFVVSEVNRPDQTVQHLQMDRLLYESWQLNAAASKES